MIFQKIALPKTGLAFFEREFKGIMPLEILVNTKKEKGAMRNNSLKKINALEQYLETLQVLTPPLSLVTFLKAANQAFFKR